LKEKLELNSNAVMLRKELGEDDSSPVDVFSLINNLNNFTLIHFPMSERISGMCFRLDEHCFVVINSALSYGRQRYSGAHELYHLFFQKELTSVICAKDIEGVKKIDEKYADTFASYFLAPDVALKSYIEKYFDKKNSLGINGVVKIEQHFQMSRQATLVRLQSDGYLSAAAASTMKQNVIQSARRLGYDDKLYVPTLEDKQRLTIGEYIGLAEKLNDSDIISQGKYEEYLLDAYRSDIVYNLGTEGEDKYD
jgi:Zn-dependent peptidase ImmA (M78 family)